MLQWWPHLLLLTKLDDEPATTNCILWGMANFLLLIVCRSIDYSWYHFSTDADLTSRSSDATSRSVDFLIISHVINCMWCNVEKHWESLWKTMMDNFFYWCNVLYKFLWLNICYSNLIKCSHVCRCWLTAWPPADVFASMTGNLSKLIALML